MRRSVIGARRIWITLGAILMVAPLLTTLPARVAEAADPDCVESGAQTICTFSYTGASQTWTVPNGVTEAQFDAYGASGGNARYADDGGKGGRATATFSVTSGDQIVVMVGGQGSGIFDDQGQACGDHIPQGGFNGGGNAGGTTCPGAGGGGASDVRIGGTGLSDRVLVAGGGGGAVNIIVYEFGIRYGGAGGGLVGLVGGPNVTEWLSVRGQGGNADCTSGSGQLGIGGDGASNTTHGSGGGGGGYCGGSGGQTAPDGEGTGGGGGSGFGPDGTVFETDVRSGNGQVIVTFDTPDTVAPTTTATYSNGYTPGTWTNQAVTVTLTATDNVGGSGVAATYYGLTNPLCAPASPQGCSVYTGPFTIPSESGAIVLFFSVDAAGNTESLNTVLVSIDQTDPYAAPTISGTEGDNGWYTSAVTVTWNWTDDLSDLDTTRCPATSSSNSDGEASISATCYDQAGNDYEASVPVKIDQTPPAGNPTISGTLGDNGWYVGQVTVTWNWADATSGTNSCPPVTNALAEGQYTITANCSDMAGNTATGSVPIKIDQTPPAFAPTTNGTEGDNFWYTSPVTVTWNWTDPTSGINPTTCPTTTLVTTDGEQEVMEACRDLAGNVAAGRSVVRIDQTPPTVTYSGNAGSYGVDDQIEITCTASDATSGIASTTCQNITGPAASFELGTHTFSATATDNAGHTSSATTTFTIGLDYDSLAALTCQMVNQQTWCSTLSYYLASAEWAEGRHVGTLQQHYLNLYATMVTSLRNRGLSAQDAQTLLNLVQILQPPVTRGR